MADLVRFHVFFQEGFGPNGSQNKRADEAEFTSFSAAKRAASEHFERYRQPLVVCQSNPRRSGDRYNARMWLGGR